MSKKKGKGKGCRLALLAFLLPGCVGISAADAAADLATIEWASPLIEAQIPQTPAADQPLHRRTLASWRERVDAKLRAAGVTK